MHRTPRRSAGRRSQPYPASQPAAGASAVAGPSTATPSTPTGPSPGRGSRGLFQNGNWFCDCNPRRKAAHRETRKPGNNQGRWFYTCPQERKRQCNFFIWEDYAGMNGAAGDPSTRSTYRTSIGRRTTPDRGEGPSTGPQGPRGLVSPPASSPLQGHTAGSRARQAPGQAAGSLPTRTPTQRRQVPQRTQRAQPTAQSTQQRPSRQRQRPAPQPMPATQPTPATQPRQRIFTAPSGRMPELPYGRPNGGPAFNADEYEDDEDDDEDDFEPPPTPTPATRRRRTASEKSNARITQYFAKADTAGEGPSTAAAATSNAGADSDYSDSAFDSEMERVLVALADHSELESRRAEQKSLVGDIRGAADVSRVSGFHGVAELADTAVGGAHEATDETKGGTTDAVAAMPTPESPETTLPQRFPRRQLLIASQAYQQAVAESSQSRGRGPGGQSGSSSQGIGPGQTAAQSSFAASFASTYAPSAASSTQSASFSAAPPSPGGLGPSVFDTSFASTATTMVPPSPEEAGEPLFLPRTKTRRSGAFVDDDGTDYDDEAEPADHSTSAHKRVRFTAPAGTVNSQLSTPPPTQHKGKGRAKAEEDEDEASDRHAVLGDPMDIDDGDVFVSRHETQPRAAAAATLAGSSSAAAVKREPGLSDEEPLSQDHPVTSAVLGLLADQPVPAHVLDRVRALLNGALCIEETRW